MSTLTQENAAGLVGRQLDAKKRVFHYYPLRVVKQPSSYHVIDRNGTMFRIPSESEGGIHFDYMQEL